MEYFLCNCRREHVAASGGEVARLRIVGGAEVTAFRSFCFIFLTKTKKRILLWLSLN